MLNKALLTAVGSTVGDGFGKIFENSLEPLFNSIRNKFMTESVSTGYFPNGIPVPLMVFVPNSIWPSTVGSGFGNSIQEYVNLAGNKK